MLAGADVYIGVSGGTVPEEVVASMAPDAIIFGLANPTPEVHPDVAHRHARGRRHRALGLPQPDQQRAGVPGHLPRRASTSRATAITEGMKLAAARAIADIVQAPTAERIVPSVFDPGVAEAVAEAVRGLAPVRARPGRPAGG